MSFDSKACAEFYKENGYFIYENALTPAEIADLRNETTHICRGEAGPVRGLQAADGLSDDEMLRRYVCIHFPHKISQTMHDYLGHPAIVDVLTSVIGPNVKAMQSMLFIKASGKPGQAWHQDEHYIPTRDRSLCGAWIALDDATVDNGCLWMVPGSHRTGYRYPTRVHGLDEYDFAEEAWDNTDPDFRSFDDHDPIPVEVAAGDVVFFNGHLLHKSLKNRSEVTYRRALVNHYANAWTTLPWNLAGGISVDEYRMVVPTTGLDPYAWKGYGDQPTHVFIRPHTR